MRSSIARLHPAPGPLVGIVYFTSLLVNATQKRSTLLLRQLTRYHAAPEGMYERPYCSTAPGHDSRFGEKPSPHPGCCPVHSARHACPPHAQKPATLRVFAAEHAAYRPGGSDRAACVVNPQSRNEKGIPPRCACISLATARRGCRNDALPVYLRDIARCVDPVSA